MSDVATQVVQGSGVTVALVTATLAEATTPLPAPSRVLPGVGEAVPFVTALDQQETQLCLAGWEPKDEVTFDGHHYSTWTKPSTKG